MTLTSASLEIMHEARVLAIRGYGWEDVCVTLDISKGSVSGQQIRRLVLRRGWRGVWEEAARAGA